MADPYFATTRQFTGTPLVHRGYVYDRTTGKVVIACRHRHRYQDRAGMCAERLLRAVRRGQAATVRREADA